jgi:hypothetical protein
MGQEIPPLIPLEDKPKFPELRTLKDDSHYILWPVFIILSAILGYSVMEFLGG